jgi:hypothetical protein
VFIIETDCLRFLNSQSEYICRALQRRNTENSKQIFPGNELRGHSPNSDIHVSFVSDLYIPPIGLPILLHENRWPNVGIHRSLKGAQV